LKRTFLQADQEVSYLAMIYIDEFLYIYHCGIARIDFFLTKICYDEYCYDVMMKAHSSTTARTPGGISVVISGGASLLLFTKDWISK